MPRIMTCGNTMSSSPVKPLLFLGLKYHVDFRLYSTLSSSSRSTRSTFHLYSLQQMFDLVKILLNLGQIYENPRKFSCRGLKLELIKLKCDRVKALRKILSSFLREMKYESNKNDVIEKIVRALEIIGYLSFFFTFLYSPHIVTMFTNNLLIEKRPDFLQLRFLAFLNFIHVGHVEQVDFEVQRQWEMRPHIAYLVTGFQCDLLRHA